MHYRKQTNQIIYIKYTRQNTQPTPADHFPPRRAFSTILESGARIPTSRLATRVVRDEEWSPEGFSDDGPSDTFMVLTNGVWFARSSSRISTLST